MTVYGNPQNEPATELELEDQRTGVDPGADPVTDDVASPLWVAGLGSPSGDYGRLSPPGGDASRRRAIGSRFRSMFTRHRRQPMISALLLLVGVVERAKREIARGDVADYAPLLDQPPKVHSYKPDTWGPKEADKLTADVGGWRDPWVES
jgi:hypothetical protein